MANTERKMVTLPDSVMRHHKHAMSSKQCGSTHIKEIAAPLGAVWSVVRRFDCPQAYKSFVRNSRICVGDGKRVGSIREIQVASGLPATVSIERLEVLDDEQHVIRFSIIGGDHRLVNYRSTMSLHEDGGGRTVVVESYVVDVPPGNCKEETCIFVDTIIGCNLSSLAKKVIF